MPSSPHNVEGNVKHVKQLMNSKTKSTSVPGTSANQHQATLTKAGPSSSVNMAKVATATTSAAVAKKKHERKVQRKKITKDKNKQKGIKKSTTANSTGSQISLPTNMEVDPDEPVYCLCKQVSYGEMAGCDNRLCPIEWFHFPCVSLTTKRKGKWFCPICRDDERAISMKPMPLFLKELEKYNREKDETPLH